MEFTIGITESNGLTEREQLALSGEIGEALDGLGVEVLGVEADPLEVAFYADDHAEAEDILEQIQTTITKDGWEGIKLGLSAPEE